MEIKKVANGYTVKDNINSQDEQIYVFFKLEDALAWIASCLPRYPIDCGKECVVTITYKEKEK